MGVNVELRSHGPRPRKGRPKTTLISDVVDIDDVFADLLGKSYGSGKSPVLDRIDPYGYVVMDRTDAKGLLRNLAQLAGGRLSSAEQTMVEDVTALAEALNASTEPNLHLHFVGD